MADTVPTLSPNAQEAPAWRMPVLVAAGLLAVFVLGGITFMMLTNGGQSPKPRASNTNTTVHNVGTPLDWEKAETLITELTEPSVDTNSLLAFTTLRTTHAGTLASWSRVEAQNPTDVALILELLGNNRNESVIFSFTKEEVQNIEMFMVGYGDVTPIEPEVLEEGNGISITRIVNVMVESEPDEIIIEVVKQLNQL